jgi:hypothetical protein
MFMTDGYGNARVHKFSAEGKHLFSWGEPGNAPGQARYGRTKKEEAAQCPKRCLPKKTVVLASPMRILRGVIRLRKTFTPRRVRIIFPVQQLR